MIYTVTMNPSLDYMITMNGFSLGKTNRTVAEQMMPGGKGINVSIVLKNLGLKSTALGFVAGFTGEEIKRRVEELGLDNKFLRVSEGVSRINIKMKEYEGTEINGQGPFVSEKETEQLMRQLECLQTEDMLVLAGSVARGMKPSVYKDILSGLSTRGVRCVVDASGDSLLNVLEYHPFLIKPNQHELGELFGVHPENREQVVPYARKLQKMGAENVLVSLAGEGAVLAAADGNVYSAPVPPGKLVNGVGAGDSMVAGFLAGWSGAIMPLGTEQKISQYKHAFLLAVAAGSASAYSEQFATAEEIRKLYHHLSGSV